MNIKIQKAGLGLLMMLLLVGCQKPADYPYYMTHPEALQKAFSRCEPDGFVAPGCDVVRQAANDFAELVTERSQGPELFGKKILEAELQLADAKTELNRVKGAGVKLTQAKEAYQAHHQKVRVLLAVVAATSAE